MCTLSVFASPDGGLVVTGNRDEHRQRSEPGQLNATDQHCFPVDGLTGGTWIGVSRAGLVMAILNRYQDPLKDDVVTRGEIIPGLLHCGDLAAAKQAMLNLPLSKYNPFDLVVVSLDGLLHLSNNGVSGKLQLHDVATPFFITSSLVDAGFTLTLRRELFETFCMAGDVSPERILDKLHLNQLPDDLVSSILMSRSHSHTKSITQVLVSSTELPQMRYITEPVIEQLRSRTLSAGQGLEHDLTLSYKFSN